MRSFFILLFLVSYALALQAQFVQLIPGNATAEDATVLRFDAREGNAALLGQDKVYLHHGLVLSSPNGTDWNYVIGNWGQDDGVGEMTLVSGETDVWEIAFEPNIRTYFGADADDQIFRISAVFRSADGSIKGTTTAGSYGWGEVTSNLDAYINLNTNQFISIDAPTQNAAFLHVDETVLLKASCFPQADSLVLTVRHNGNERLRTVEYMTTGIQSSFTPAQSGIFELTATAYIDGTELVKSKTYNWTIIKDNVIEELPAGLIPGINYAADPSVATLVLEAPNKPYAYLVGDHSDWLVMDSFQMKQTPDGNYFWLQLSNLNPGQAYVFQYWLDDDIKIGDPYAALVVDPWNDHAIPESVFPDVPEYEHQAYGMATVLQTGQDTFQWADTENNWQKPDLNHLVIYELLLRDFVGTHSFETLKDTLNYFKSLGIEAIELMPFNEFEGNDSWGYNPAYYFAPDKYYGTAEDIKEFVQAAHQAGLAVIMDAVMNHAYGQNPMVKLYFDYASGKPTADNPWFNRDYVGPYVWGYDWNHESAYTQRFLDRLNRYWVDEFHIDGYRFDFTKGFTNYQPGGSLETYDASRIAILKRMANELWATNPGTYIILEHFGQSSEEQELANYGMKLWSNRSYDYVPAVTGRTTGSFASMDRQSHISYFESHDEQRLGYHCLHEGIQQNSYNVKEEAIMLERLKMNAAFGLLFPGPKMFWQFGELGYDIDINYDGRLGRKPLPWGPDGNGYYDQALRQYVLDAYKGILDVRHRIGAAQLASATSNHKLSGNTRRLSFDTDSIDLVVFGNFDTQEALLLPKYTETGWWYDYFSGDSMLIDNLVNNERLQPGEWHLMTNQRLHPGNPEVVATYSNPVIIQPNPFTQTDSITIWFDATKAWPDSTLGLLDANKVYMHAAVSLQGDTNRLDIVKGNFTDDGLGLMKEIDDNFWSIGLHIDEYFELMDGQQAFALGMYFRDENNENLGKGFRNNWIWFNIDLNIPFITVTPESFSPTDSITITFNTAKGSRELIAADKVYMHSSVDLTNTTTPQNSAWNHVVGNWGADDGVGAMIRDENNPNLWRIKILPTDYYDIAADADIYWLAAVFRNEDGSIKGTGTPGPISNGFIHTNLDFFIENKKYFGTASVRDNTFIYLGPNPSTEYLFIHQLESFDCMKYQLYDMRGRLHLKDEIQLNGRENHTLDLQHLNPGQYILRMDLDGLLYQNKIIMQ